MIQTFLMVRAPIQIWGNPVECIAWQNGPRAVRVNVSGAAIWERGQLLRSVERDAAYWFWEIHYSTRGGSEPTLALFSGWLAGNGAGLRRTQMEIIPRRVISRRVIKARWKPAAKRDVANHPIPKGNLTP